MTVRKLSRSLWSLLITLTLAFAGVSFAGAANAIQGETGDIYRAYTEKSPSTANTNIYVHPDGDESSPIVALLLQHPQTVAHRKQVVHGGQGVLST